MPTLQITTEQVQELVKQLTPDAKRALWLALAEEARARREERMKFATSQLRRVAAERGLNWDSLSEEEREAFIDDLIHEDRPCMT